MIKWFETIVKSLGMGYTYKKSSSKKILVLVLKRKKYNLKPLLKCRHNTSSFYPSYNSSIWIKFSSDYQHRLSFIFLINIGLPVHTIILFSVVIQRRLAD